MRNVIKMLFSIVMRAVVTVSTRTYGTGSPDLAIPRKSLESDRRLRSATTRKEPVCVCVCVYE